jgi:hypothetical protein
LSHFVANLIISKLDPEAPLQVISDFFQSAGHTNHSTVARFVNDERWPQSVQEEKVFVLYLDATAYMLKAATALKVSFQNLIHFTCMAHGLQHVAEEVRVTFPTSTNLLHQQKSSCESPTMCAMLQILVA